MDEQERKLIKKKKRVVKQIVLKPQNMFIMAMHNKMNLHKVSDLVKFV